MSENQNDTKPTNAGVDKELDDLLDSALQDMTKPQQLPVESPSVNPSGEVAEAQPFNPESLWSDEYIREAAKQFETNMASLLGNANGVEDSQISQEQIAATFQKMAEAAAQVMQPIANNTKETTTQTQSAPLQVENELSAAITQTLQSLNTNTDNIQTPFSDQDLANMFANFSMDSGQDGENMFVPFMQGMMQSLLSKEVLYPSLKELADKYPTWFEENKDKGDAADMERYRKQYDLILVVCTELEKETAQDSEETKKNRFNVVLEKMQQMQDLGQPPAELAGELGEMPTGLIPPSIMEGGQDNAQCSIM